MDPLVVVSPHLDDAVLSVGQIMAGRPDCHVVTVFAGTPQDRYLRTDYDRLCGFRTALQAMGERRREDAAACATLHATVRHLDHLDHQYRPTPALAPGEPERLTLEILEAIDETGADVALGPVGIEHVDHVHTARAFRRALEARPNVEGWIYEELPGRVLFPEATADAILGWRGVEWPMPPPPAGPDLPPLGFLGTGPRDLKARAIDCYRSQLGADLLDWPTLLVPERVRKLER